jgi:hypothetical protein
VSDLRLQLWTIYLTPEPTGIPPVITPLAQLLRERGWEADVVAAHPHYPEPRWGTRLRPCRKVRDGIKVLRVPTLDRQEHGRGAHAPGSELRIHTAGLDPVGWGPFLGDPMGCWSFHRVSGTAARETLVRRAVAPSRGPGSCPSRRREEQIEIGGLARASNWLDLSAARRSNAAGKGLLRLDLARPARDRKLVCPNMRFHAPCPGELLDPFSSL